MTYPLVIRELFMHRLVQSMAPRVYRWQTQLNYWWQASLYRLGLKHPPSVSIIINNYNYAQFLPEAIDSALAQRYPIKIEVIVVDDGSTDDSKSVIESYGARVTALLKENGGQASAFNLGFEQSCGEIVLFLDADDMLRPTAVLQAVAALAIERVLKVHWHQHEVDASGHRTGGLVPAWELTKGNLREAVINHDLDLSIIAQTSGNAWKRRYLEVVYPIPEMGDKHGADEYLCCLLPLFGDIAYIPEPQGFYRVHGANHRSSNKRSPLQIRRSDLKRRECVHQCIDKYLQQQGLEVDPSIWRNKPDTHYTWSKQILELYEAVEAQIPVGEMFILVDAGEWQDLFRDRTPIPFLECDGQYSGYPADATIAIQELERLRQAGATFIVFAWITFWWFDIFAGFHQYLLEQYQCTFEDERCVVFRL